MIIIYQHGSKNNSVRSDSWWKLWAQVSLWRSCWYNIGLRATAEAHPTRTKKRNTDDNPLCVSPSGLSRGHLDARAGPLLTRECRCGRLRQTQKGDWKTEIAIRSPLGMGAARFSLLSREQRGSCVSRTSQTQTLRHWNCLVSHLV